MSFSRLVISHDVLVMSPSILFNSPFIPLSFSRYVRLIFHVCPVLSVPVISLHLPSCPLASLSFVSLSFPLHSPCFHFFPLHVPFSSPLFPFHFPLLSCHVDFPFPSLISLHFLAFPLCSPVIPVFFPQNKNKQTRLFPRFRKKDVKITARYVGHRGTPHPGTLRIRAGGVIL